jgi:uncharacterized protein
MELNEITYTDAVPFDSYGPGFFRVAGHVIEGPALVTLTAARSWGGLGIWLRSRCLRVRWM